MLRTFTQAVSRCLRQPRITFGATHESDFSPVRFFHDFYGSITITLIPSKVPPPPPTTAGQAGPWHPEASILFAMSPANVLQNQTSACHLSACPTVLVLTPLTRFTKHYKRSSPLPADENPEPLKDQKQDQEGVIDIHHRSPQISLVYSQFAKNRG